MPVLEVGVASAELALSSLPCSELLQPLSPTSPLIQNSSLQRVQQLREQRWAGVKGSGRLWTICVHLLCVGIVVKTKDSEIYYRK